MPPRQPTPSAATAQQRLAADVTARVHGEDAARAAQRATAACQEDVRTLTKSDLEMLKVALPYAKLPLEKHLVPAAGSTVSSERVSIAHVAAEAGVTGSSERPAG